MLTKLVCSVFLSCLLLTANAQFRNIPPEVTDNFKTKFPKATHVEWKDKISSFQAEFEDGKGKAKASFSSKGEWLKTEKKLDFATLPGDVKDGFSKSKFADYAVKEASEIDDKEKGLLYLVVVKKGDLTKRNLYFTATGQLVKDDVNF
jgi:hypothetical protein